MVTKHGETLLIFLLISASVDSSVNGIIQTAAVGPVFEQQNSADILSRGSYIGERIDYEYDEPTNKTHNSHFDNEDDDSEVDQGDSEVSEERSGDRGVFLGDNREGLKEVKPDHRRVAPVVIINSAFNNRKSFACPKIKSDLKTGTSIGDLSPEDITIIASMGDALAVCDLDVEVKCFALLYSLFDFPCI
ncbi:unnamed protein product [Nippostrongylus brasiliensis]|uniref:Secreted phosphoprotein 24 n=1 Tax=Nippostrongylus brasiliensis TaxID=27835 RepID=A0A158QY23_NIPBR|nr:unnamed protein product [Nippostrongylus brasiliensis]